MGLVQNLNQEVPKLGKKSAFFSPKLFSAGLFLFLTYLQNKWLDKPFLYCLVRRNPGQFLPEREVIFGGEVLACRKHGSLSWFSCRLPAWCAASGLILPFSRRLNRGAGIRTALRGAPAAPALRHSCSDVAGETFWGLKNALAVRKGSSIFPTSRQQKDSEAQSGSDGSLSDSRCGGSPAWGSEVPLRAVGTGC